MKEEFMSVFILASLGGLTSFLSTSLGSVLTQVFSKARHLKNLHMSMDFTLGVMLSAAAFLIAPEFLANSSMSLMGLIAGLISILFLHAVIHKNSHDKNASTHLLIAALIFHNFPEGMGSGASLAGMDLHMALSLQGALTIQNVMEGMLLTLLLKSLGLSNKCALAGGIGSGVVELLGGVLSGFILNEALSALPFLLSLAGGAMVGSVLMEIYEQKGIKFLAFAKGLILIPLMNQFF